MALRKQILIRATAVFLSFATIAIQANGQNEPNIGKDSSGIVTIPATLTGEGLKALVQPLIGSLNDLGANLIGGAGGVLLGTSTQLGGLMNQLDTMLQGNVKAPLDSLGMDVRALAGRIYAAVEQLNFLLDRQRQCAFLNLDEFLSGVQTVTQNLKEGFPFVKSGDPYLNTFRFDGKTSSNIIPPEGGRFTVTGFDLWKDKAPIVRLKSVDRQTVIGALDPQPAANTDSVSLVFDPLLVGKHSGECLQLEVEVHRGRSFLFIPLHDDIFDRYLPMCIPSAYTEQIQLTANVSYSTRSKAERLLPPEKEFRFDNNDGDKHAVSHSDGWSLPDGCQIIGVSTRDGEMRNTEGTSISFGWAGNIVTATGTIDSASCAPFRGCYRSAIWAKEVTPNISCDVDVPQAGNAQSPLVKVALPETSTCVNVAQSVAAPKNTVWISLINAVNGQASPVPFYQGARITTNANAVDLGPDQVIPFSITGSYNPTPVGGMSQVCVKLTNTQQCGY
jgi:hypothetical protein